MLWYVEYRGIFDSDRGSDVSAAVEDRCFGESGPWPLFVKDLFAAIG
jgi:hypothetical protein